jgi:hypothetical protein
MKRDTFISMNIADRSTKKAIDRLSKIDKKFRNDLGILVMQTANKIASDTKRPSNFPYVTGFLKGSYQADTTQTRRTLSAVVGSIADYAPNVEFGTSPHEINSPIFIKGVGWRFIGMHPGTKAQPFFIPAVDKNEPRFYAGIEKLIEHFDK